MTLGALLPIVVVVLAARAAAQAPMHAWIDWGNDMQPSSVAPAGDRDGDGVPELFLGSFHGDRVHVVSGVDRVPLFDFPTISPALSIAAVRDLDGDGLADVMTGELYDGSNGSNRGAARVYSGATGAVIHECLGLIDEGHFGARIANLGDIDGDSFDDLAVCSRGLIEPAYGRVYSGRTGGVLSNYRAKALDLLLSGAGDVDGDGFADILRTDPDEFVATNARGRARLISGRTGTLIREIVGVPGELAFGALCGPAGDANGDGYGDVLLGSGGSVPSNVVRVYSGIDGAVLFGLSMGNHTGGPLATTYALSIGDVDGDGSPDIALKSIQRIVDVFSGATSQLIHRYVLSIDAWGISSPVDLNRDGLDDLVITGWFGGYVGRFALHAFASGWPAPAKYCTAQTSSDGCAPSMHVLEGGVSLTVGDQLEIVALHVSAEAPGMLLWNTAAANTPFHGGSLCVAQGAALHRTSLHFSGREFGLPCAGSLRHVLRRSYLAAHALTPGTTIYAQFISRDPDSPHAGKTNLTDALAITLAP